jgi:hypothetical protein
MISIFIPTMLLVALALFARISLGSWLSPGAFFPLFWSCLVIPSLLVADYPVWDVALWWIVGSLLAFYLGSLLAAIAGRRLPIDRTGFSFSAGSTGFPKLALAVVLLSVSGVVYGAYRDTYAPLIMDSPPAWFQLLLAGLYASPIFGGMLFASSRSRRDRVIGLMSTGPALFSAVAFLGRGPLLAGAYFWLGGYWSVRILLIGGCVRLLTVRIVVASTALASALVVIGMGIGTLRVIGVAQQISLGDRLQQYPEILRQADTNKEWAGFRHAVFSHVYAFSYYLEQALKAPRPLHYGMLTFAGPLELVGLRERSPYESFQPEPGVNSNVYSLFMPPIEDFGLVGSFLSFFGAGLIAGWGYSRVTQGDARFIPVLTMFYPHVMVIGGYFFSYNSMVLAHVYVGLYLASVGNPRRRSPEPVPWRLHAHPQRGARLTVLSKAADAQP